MLGLFGTLGMGTRALQAQQRGIETAGHNLANVNNPAYARQRIHLRTSSALPTPTGPVGTGVAVTHVMQMRDALLDRRIATEASISGYWQAQQQALQYAQAGLGQDLDRQATGPAGAAAASGTQRALAEGLQDLFSAFQSVATSPTSLTERQALLQKAQSLAMKFNLTDARLAELQAELNARLEDDVAAANELLKAVARLNNDLLDAEMGGGVANDLRDLRQAKLEALARLVKVDAVEDATGNLDLSLGGTALVSGNLVNDTLQTYDAGTGARLIRTAAGGVALTLTGGAMQGTMDARDGAVADLRRRLDTVATQLLAQINTVHAAGYSLTGGTGAAFFTGTGAADLAVNAALAADPALVQAAGVAGAVGDNRVAVALAQLAEVRLAPLGNQTFQQNYAQTVAALGQSLAATNEQVSDQEAVARMLDQQRASVSGVSLDEEMTDLVKFQKAFAASAKLVTTVDELLELVVNLKR